MKSRVLMAALVVTLLMGTQGFASDCGPCDPAVDPCGSCDGCAKSVDLFAGLRSLVARSCAINKCDPCEGVVACTPCEEIDPCGSSGNDCTTPKFSLRKKLKGLFASKGCDPCEPVDDGNCKPCDDASSCDPCDPCGTPKFSIKKLFKGFKIGTCDTGCTDPCSPCGDDDNSCKPCDDAGSCDPCDPCGGKGLKLGRLIDAPRRGLKKFFDGFTCGTSCNPCDEVDNCKPCDDVAPCDKPCK